MPKATLLLSDGDQGSAKSKDPVSRKIRLNTKPCMYLAAEGAPAAPWAVPLNAGLVGHVGDEMTGQWPRQGSRAGLLRFRSQLGHLLAERPHQ